MLPYLDYPTPDEQVVLSSWQIAREMILKEKYNNICHDKKELLGSRSLRASGIEIYTITFFDAQLAYRADLLMTLGSWELGASYLSTWKAINIQQV